MLKGLYHEERRWPNWLEFATCVEKNRWLVTKLPEPADRLVNAQSIDNYQTYSVSAFKRKVGINVSVSACDVSGQERS